MKKIKNLLINLYRSRLLFVSIFDSLIKKIKYSRIKPNGLLGNEHFTLLLTNSMGGGTKQFLRNFTNNESNLLVLTNYSYAWHDFCFLLEKTNTGEKCVLNKKQILKLLESEQIEKLIINTLVSNFFIYELLKKMAFIKKKIIIFIHDFFCICPAFNLFTTKSFCNFVSCEKNTCFKFDAEAYNKFLLPRKVNILEWRRMWGNVFKNTFEIRCFSDSSKLLLSIVYPEYKNKLTVYPHDMSYCTFTKAKVQKRNMIVGIIGAISSLQKGKQLVKEFLDFSIKNNITVKILGSSKIKNKKIKNLGPYNNKDLQKIIENEGINCVFFPTLCPETFSYLVSEIIQLDIPIVAFNYGAQAEKVKKYRKGVICESLKMNDIYASLIEAYKLL